MRKIFLIIALLFLTIIPLNTHAEEPIENVFSRDEYSIAYFTHYYNFITQEYTTGSTGLFGPNDIVLHSDYKIKLNPTTILKSNPITKLIFTFGDYAWGFTDEIVKVVVDFEYKADDLYVSKYISEFSCSADGFKNACEILGTPKLIQDTENYKIQLVFYFQAKNMSNLQFIFGGEPKNGIDNRHKQNLFEILDTEDDRYIIQKPHISFYRYKCTDSVNLLPETYFSKSGNYGGVDITVNDDGSIKLKGKLTSNAYFFLVKDFPNLTHNGNFSDIVRCDNGYCGTDGLHVSYYSDTGLSNISLNLQLGKEYDETIYPMITKGDLPEEYQAPGSLICPTIPDIDNPDITEPENPGGGTDEKDPNKETNEKLNDLNNSIKDDTPPNVNDKFSNDNVIGMLPPGPLDSIINLPLALLNGVSTALNGTCSSIVLPVPFSDDKLTIPCVRDLYSKINGLDLVINSFSVILSGLMLYKYFIYLYNWVDGVISLDKKKFRGWGADV